MWVIAIAIPEKGCYTFPMTMTANVLDVFHSCSFDSYARGMTWYDEAHEFAQTLGNVHRSAGVIAALSPMNGWPNNKNKAAQLYAQGHGAGCGLYRNVDKAMRIYNGEDALDVLGGRKVRSFYLSIVDPSSELAEPVIDRHAFDVAVGRRTSNAERAVLGKKGEYDRFAEAYIYAAGRVGLTPKQLQAITWVEWKDRLDNPRT
jgi:hypothetical protein